MADDNVNQAQPRKIWKDLGARLVTGLGFAIFCFIPLYLGGYVWVALVALMGARMIFEWVRMSDHNGSNLTILLPVAGFIISIITYFSFDLKWTFVALIATAILVIIERFKRGQSHMAALGFLYVAIPCLCLILLRGTEKGVLATGFLLVLFIILVVIAADVGAYFGGSYFKGPKLAPKLSPKKTWSGFVCGIISGLVMGIILALFMGFSPASGAALAVPITILSVVGDFFESWLKRRMEVKDTGGLLPGHGGILDRLDSHMFAISVAALVLYFNSGIWPLA